MGTLSTKSGRPRTDELLGERIRRRRRELQMSQHVLAAARFPLTAPGVLLGAPVLRALTLTVLVLVLGRLLALVRLGHGPLLRGRR